jgi:hypothetical protein
MTWNVTDELGHLSRLLVIEGIVTGVTVGIVVSVTTYGAENQPFIC